MPRTNPEIQRLNMIVDSYKKQLDDRRKDPGDFPVVGCGDSSCSITKPTGMSTNGGCRCEIHKFRWALQYYKNLNAFREEIIRDLREKLESANNKIHELEYEKICTQNQ